jgi:predicted ATPase with chaperone activity
LGLFTQVHFAARDRQTARYVKSESKPDALGDIVLCMRQLQLFARAYHRTRSVKLARTIADLAGNDEIQSVHLVEALHASQPPEDHDRVEMRSIF